jgi:hypothetical protein
MKRNPQKNGDKKLAAKNLLTVARNEFEQISEPKRNDSRGKKNLIKLKDCLMSALAMFSLKSPSLLAFDEAKEDEIVKHNLKTLYGIEHVPSDTYMRERLDIIDPKEIRKAFLSVFEQLQRGKLLERYVFINNTYLLATDGTGMFNSDKISCDNCCKKTYKDGKVEYYHNMLCGAIVHPDHKQVIPLCPEPISKQDGALKNDCEMNAGRRFLADLKREHPKLKFTILSDAIIANTPSINNITEFGYNYIINVKPDGNKSLFEFIDGLFLDTVKITLGKNKYTFRYINKVPLNDAKNAPDVNFIECIAEEMEGKKLVKRTFTWVTDHNITNENVMDIMRGGRARWKIENETFNTLKNQGYQFEHNFGHGDKNLNTILAMLMLLAFLIDQVQEASCGVFQAGMKKVKRRRTFWERVRSFFHLLFIDSWEDLYNAIAFGYDRITLKPNTSDNSS